MDLFFVLLLALGVVASVTGTVVVVARDGYRRVPEDPCRQ